MNYIEELQNAIRHMHGAESTHVDSVPVKEIFKGETVWDGIVEVFDLHGHPKASRVYAWGHETENPDRPKRHVTVLHVHPINSPAKAVRAAIMQELREFDTAEET